PLETERRRESAAGRGESPAATSFRGTGSRSSRGHERPQAGVAVARANATGHQLAHGLLRMGGKQAGLPEQLGEEAGSATLEGLSQAASVARKVVREVVSSPELDGTVFDGCMQQNGGCLGEARRAAAPRCPPHV